MKHINSSWLVVVLLLDGCAQSFWQDFSAPQQNIAGEDVSIADYHAFYRRASNVWIGHNVSELLAQLGPPHMILDANPKGTSPRFGIHMDNYIYVPDPESADTCISAYVVVYETGEIVQYYCR